jgi:hypothetical protein
MRDEQDEAEVWQTSDLAGSFVDAWTQRREAGGQ